MEIKQFIEKAIEGGWDKDLIKKDVMSITDEDLMIERSWSEKPVRYCHKDTVFLDPLAWQAVGKVEGWKEETDYGCDQCGKEVETTQEWSANMHQMIDALAEGQSLEEFINSL